MGVTGVNAPSGLVIDSFNCEFGGNEPWPDDVQLYQPYETEQILLPDNANCLAVQAFLKSCRLKYEVEYRTNAEYMSPSGKVPFIKCGACLVSDFEPITSFVANKGISLSSHLDEKQKADMRAFMSLVNTCFVNAENYVTWVDPETYSTITKPRYGSVHPFPLNHILCYYKRKNVIRKLEAYKWAQKTLNQVYEEFEKGCSALNDRLGDEPFFFGKNPIEIDLYAFAHTYTILITPSTTAGVTLSNIIRKCPLLLNHCKMVMSLLDFNDNVDEPRVFQSRSISRLLPWESERKETRVEDEISDLCDFVFTDEIDRSYDKEYDHLMEDVSTIINEPNTIHEVIQEELQSQNPGEPAISVVS